MVRSKILTKKEKRPPTVLRIGLDLDDLIFDLAKPSLEVINKRYNTKFQRDDIKKYWYVRDFLEELRRPEKEIRAFHKELYFPPDSHRVYERSPVIPGAVRTIENLRRAGHELFIITSRPPGAEVMAAEQLEREGLGWLAGDWVEGGHILIRDQNYWQKFSKGDGFKLTAVWGKFPRGKYRDFPGLDLHFDDMGLLFNHPLINGVEDRVFILDYPYNSAVPQKNLVNNWWVFNKVARCLARGDSLDWLVSHN